MGDDTKPASGGVNPQGILQTHQVGAERAVQQGAAWPSLVGKSLCIFFHM